MLSERQLAANRQNAQKSTGPRTAEGKSVCAQNASRHAKLADEVLLACEDRTQFIRHSRRYHREFQPVGHLEKSLVNDMVAASWRRDRLGVLEARLIDHSYNTIPAPLLPEQAPDAPAPHPDHSPVAFRNALGYRELVDTSKVLPQLSRDAARHNRDFHKALATLLRLRATQAQNPPAPKSGPNSEDPFYKGKYDRPVIPPPADPPGTIPEDLLGLFGSVSAPEPCPRDDHNRPDIPMESTIYESDSAVSVVASGYRTTCGNRRHPRFRARSTQRRIRPNMPPRRDRKGVFVRTAHPTAQRATSARPLQATACSRQNAATAVSRVTETAPQAEPRPRGSVYSGTETTPRHGQLPFLGSTTPRRDRTRTVTRASGPRRF